MTGSDSASPGGVAVTGSPLAEDAPAAGGSQLGEKGIALRLFDVSIAGEATSARGAGTNWLIRAKAQFTGKVVSA